MTRSRRCPGSVCERQNTRARAQQALGHNSKACAMPARNTLTCRAVVTLCGSKAEVTVPSLDDWEKDWQENPQRSVQPKLLPVDSVITYPTNRSVRQHFAWGLVKALTNRLNAKDYDRADGLLTESRELLAKYPDDDEIRTQLAKGLSNTIGYGRNESREVLLLELCLLAKNHPNLVIQENVTIHDVISYALNQSGVTLMSQARTTDGAGANKLSKAEAESGDTADALYKLAGEKFEQALRIKSDSDKLLCNYGFVLLTRAESANEAEAGILLKRAYEILEQAQRINPNDCRILFNLTWLFVCKNDAKTAIYWYRLLINNDPDMNRSALEAHPDFEKIRKYPLFNKLLKELEG
jgi:tetratricopeptide (TPR) repeat protein